MSNEMGHYRLNNWELRHIWRDEEPWFIVADVCRCLGLGKPNDVTKYLDDDEKGTISSRTPGGTQEISIVSEAGLYSLILRSRKPDAKKFKRWITHEVLPAIRKHGMYATEDIVNRIMADPSFGINLLTKYKEEQDARKRAELAYEQVADENHELVIANHDLSVAAVKNAPKVEFAEVILAAKGAVPVGDVAKVICQAGHKCGQKTLFKWLRRHKYLMTTPRSENQPQQWALNKNLFEIRESTYPSASNPGERHVCFTTLVTPKGEMEIVNHYIRTGGR